MIDLPSFGDVVVAALHFLGIPLAVLAPFVVFFWLLDWIRTARSAASSMKAGGRAVSRVVLEFTRRRVVLVVLLVFAEALVAASVFSVFRVAESVILEHGNLVPSAYTFEAVAKVYFDTALDGSTAANALWVTLGILLLFDFCHFFALELPRYLLFIVLMACIPITALATVGFGILALMVVGTTPEASGLYWMLTASLAGILLGLIGTVATSSTLSGDADMGG